MIRAAFLRVRCRGKQKELTAKRSKRGRTRDGDSDHAGRRVGARHELDSHAFTRRG
jgi:hypothetical protein